jgi:hypothetical protein
MERTMDRIRYEDRYQELRQLYKAYDLLNNKYEQAQKPLTKRIYEILVEIGCNPVCKNGYDPLRFRRTGKENRMEWHKTPDLKGI